MKRALALVLLASSPLLAGGGDAPPAASAPAAPPSSSTTSSKAREGAFARAWQALGATHNTCNQKQLDFDYWPDGGMRNFYCHATTSLALRAVTKLAGVKPFLRGPHGSAAEGKLSLHDPRDFGRYNPVFVQFLVDNAVPAANDAALREETQPLYDQFVRQLARVYFVVHERLVHNPAGMKRARDEYMRVMDEKNPDWSSYYDKYSTFLGEADTDWGGYDPNLQSASVAWWLRRDVDKTAPLFFEGLTKLLRTYDAEWLATQLAPTGAPAPKK